MNAIDRTLKNSVWYWAPAQKTGADGVPVFQPAMLLQPPNGGRWDDNPTVGIGPNGEEIMLNARFTTKYPLVAGGWLLKAGNENGKQPEDEKPTSFKEAREIHSVSTCSNYRATLHYYVGALK
ncbi:MAG: hypothetical protein WC322_06405 [Candidatus Paceibacterota bacterium]|jgi:hypothetical protein